MDFSTLFGIEADSTTNLDSITSEGEETNSEEEYSGEDLTLPPIRYEKLEVNGEEFDLRDPTQAQEAYDRAQEFREQLREGNLIEYEDRPTELWGGGRSRLLHDELMSKMALDGHEGKHTMDYTQMNEECNRIQSIRAAKLKAQGL